MPYSNGHRINKEFLNDKIEKILYLVGYVPFSDDQGLQLISGDLIHYTDLRDIFQKIDISIKSMSWNSSGGLTWIKETSWANISLLGSYPFNSTVFNWDGSQIYDEASIVSDITQDGYDILDSPSSNYEKYSKALYWNSIDYLFENVFKYYFSARSTSTDLRHPTHTETGKYSYISIGVEHPDYDDGWYYSTDGTTLTGASPSSVLSNKAIYVNGKMETQIDSPLIITMTIEDRIEDQKQKSSFGVRYLSTIFSQGSGASQSLAKIMASVLLPSAVTIKPLKDVWLNYLAKSNDETINGVSSPNVTTYSTINEYPIIVAGTLPIRPLYEVAVNISNSSESGLVRVDVTASADSSVLLGMPVPNADATTSYDSSTFKEKYLHEYTDRYIGVLVNIPPQD
jgi:hypothetical protein